MEFLIIPLLLVLLALLAILRSWLAFRRLWPLRMRRSLSDLPPVVVPEGYRLRLFQPGDEEGWVRLVNTAFAEQKRVFIRMSDPAGKKRLSLMLGVGRGSILLAERVVDGELVGTATALEEPLRRRRTGLVACVAVHPAHRGRGLGSAVLTATLHTLCERGHTQAFLNTNPALAPAVRLYERLGFVPVNRRGAARTMREATPCG